MLTNLAAKFFLDTNTNSVFRCATVLQYETMWNNNKNKLNSQYTQC